MRRGLLLLFAATAARAGALDPYADPDAGFTVMFPSPPERSERTQIVHGAQTVSHLYTSDTPKVGYVVSWTDHPESGAASAEARLQAAREAVVQANPVKAETTGKVSGFPSRRMTFDTHGARVTLQLVLVNNRLYQAMAVRPADEDHETAVATFLDSFAVTSAAAMLPAPPAPRPPGPGPATATGRDGGVARPPKRPPAGPPASPPPAR